MTHLEDALQLLGAHADAGVAHAEAQPALLLLLW
jgi:hypothetical protein